MSDLTLTLVRGLPGSGKSTFAKKEVALAKQPTIHLEADMFFVNHDGEYLFKAEQIKQAHAWCQLQCELALKQQQNVVVSNTFVKQWEMKHYRQLAMKYNALLIIKVCTGKYASIHDVPVATIKKMQQQWQS